MQNNNATSRAMSKKKTERRSAIQSPGRTTQHRVQSQLPAIGNMKTWRRAYIAGPFALAFITFFNTLWNGFASDDSYQVLQNTLIRKLGNIPLAFSRSVWTFATDDIVFSVDPFYRPMFNVLFAINYALFGTKAWGWHLVNVLLHSAVALLVFFVLLELTGKNWLSLLAACLFAVHPAHVESVAWISGVTDPLMSVFVLISFWLYLRYKKTHRSSLLIWMSGSYFLALLSKETAVALPVIIILYEFFLIPETRVRERVVSAFRMTGILVLATLLEMFMRYEALGKLIGGTRVLPLSVGIATIPIALVKYLILSIIPVGYSYQHQTEFVWSLKSASFLIPFLGVTALIVALFVIRSRFVSFAVIWFLVTLAPALYAIRQFDPENAVQERYLYLPSIGLCLILAVFLEWIIRKRIFGARTAMAAAGVSIALIIVWVSVSIIQNRVWDSDISLFRNVVSRDPQRATAHAALARAYQGAARVREADQEARTALELDPSSSRAYVILAYLANSGGKYATAVDYLQKAVEAASGQPRGKTDQGTAYLNMGLIYWQLKEYEKAEDSLIKSIEAWPRAVGWFHAGRFYFERGRLEDARSMFELAAKNVPETYPPIHLHLGQVYDLLGQKDAARNEYQMFLNLSSVDAPNRTEVSQRLQSL